MSCPSDHRSLRPTPARWDAMTARGIMILAHARPWTCDGALGCMPALQAAASRSYDSLARGGLHHSPRRGCVANTVNDPSANGLTAPAFCYVCRPTIGAVSQSFTDRRR